MTAPAHVHAANRALVVVSRPGRPTITGRLFYLPTGKSRRRSPGGRARVLLASGRIIGVPVEYVQILTHEETA